MPLIELFGGYQFARLDGGGGTGTNLNGALGSFGWNLKPWLQIVADTSYNVVTISGTKNVLYGIIGTSFLPPHKKSMGRDPVCGSSGRGIPRGYHRNRDRRLHNLEQLFVV